jgi:hypothetical protein
MFLSLAAYDPGPINRNQGSTAKGYENTVTRDDWADTRDWQSEYLLLRIFIYTEFPILESLLKIALASNS